jgi:putative transcriptional regulator
MVPELIRLGNAIRAQRLRLALSQQQLAERCGFDRTYISMLERGRRNPSLLNLIRLSEGLQITVSKLTKDCDGTDTD